MSAISYILGILLFATSGLAQQNDGCDLSVSLQLDVPVTKVHVDKTPGMRLSHSEIIALIVDDVAKLRAEGISPQRVRYLSLAHLLNAGATPEKMREYSTSLSVLVNSLSWRELKPLPALDSGLALHRVILDDYGWNATMWENILEEYSKQVPYTPDPVTPALRQIIGEPYSDFLAVRGDWFSMAAMHPAGYQNFLQLPRNIASLENFLSVDRNGNFEDVIRGKSKRLARIGFSRSGVAVHNRALERHETAFGGYWYTYDFAGSSNFQSIFRLPLGPRRGFHADGGEVIFALPNGLHGYALVNQTGRLIDEAPTNIVFDPVQSPGVIQNGISCIGCHARGILPHKDEVLKLVEQNPDLFDDEEKREIRAVYRPSDVRSGLEHDNRRYLDALSALGWEKPGATALALVDKWNGQVSYDEIAWTLGFAPEDFTEIVEKSLPLTARRELALAKMTGMQRASAHALALTLPRFLTLPTYKFQVPIVDVSVTFGVP